MSRQNSYCNPFFCQRLLWVVVVISTIAPVLAAMGGSSGKLERTSKWLISLGYRKYSVNTLGRMRNLDLSICRNCFEEGVKDEDLVHLRNLPMLRVLNLRNNHGVTDRGMVHISRLVRLRTLKLGNTAITDQGLRYLGKLHDLRFLCLEGTRISDRGLDYLTGLKNLEILHLGITISRSRAEELRAKLPHLKTLSY